MAENLSGRKIFGFISAATGIFGGFYDLLAFLLGAFCSHNFSSGLLAASAAAVRIFFGTEMLLAFVVGCFCYREFLTPK